MDAGGRATHGAVAGGLYVPFISTRVDRATHLSHGVSWNLGGLRPHPALRATFSRRREKEMLRPATIFIGAHGQRPDI